MIEVVQFQGELGIANDPTKRMEQVREAAIDKEWIPKFAEEREQDRWNVWLWLLMYAAYYGMKREGKLILAQGSDEDIAKLRSRIDSFDDLDNWAAAEQRKRDKSFPWGTVLLGGAILTASYFGIRWFMRRA